MTKTTILGSWVHAHEHDRAGTKTFVDAGEPLPPSRGRQRLTFKADGTFVDAQPGADDRTQQASGTYDFDGSQLVLKQAQGGTPLVYEARTSEDGKRLLLTRQQT